VGGGGEGAGVGDEGGGRGGGPPVGEDGLPAPDGPGGGGRGAGSSPAGAGIVRRAGLDPPGEGARVAERVGGDRGLPVRGAEAAQGTAGGGWDVKSLR